jgi:predicted porin
MLVTFRRLNPTPSEQQGIPVDHQNFDVEQPQAGRSRLGRAVKCALALAFLASGANLAQAQTSPAPSTPSEKAAVDEGLSWHGITLYGIVDLGLQYDTHGAPFSDYYPAGSADIVQKNSRQSVTGLTPSNMSQSRVGLQGVEPLGVGDLQGVFRLETFFNPQSGDLSDGPKSQVLNNGRSTATQTTNLDSSVAGEAFEIAYAGFASKTYGALTFGRQNTFLTDGISKYDPNYSSQAFSLIGLSGTYAGGGDTEDKRMDDVVKYTLPIAGIAHVGALWKFNQSNGAAGSAWQADAGADYAGASVDGYIAKTRNAISTSALSSAQVTGLPALGYSVTNSLSGTISDNTAASLMGSYVFGPVKFLAGYEYIQYDNPRYATPAGTDTIGGYVLAYVSNTAYPHPKILNVYWGGVRYTAMPGLDITGAFYGYHQNSYGTGANAHCNTTVAGTCSGYFEGISLDADYAFTKRFDAYIGAMYTAVYNGVANGYTFQRTNIDPTIGVRFKF